MERKQDKHCGSEFSFYCFIKRLILKKTLSFVYILRQKGSPDDLMNIHCVHWKMNDTLRRSDDRNWPIKTLEMDNHYDSCNYLFFIYFILFFIYLFFD